MGPLTFSQFLTGPGRVCAKSTELIVSRFGGGFVWAQACRWSKYSALFAAGQHVVMPPLADSCGPKEPCIRQGAELIGPTTFSQFISCMGLFKVQPFIHWPIHVLSVSSRALRRSASSILVPDRIQPVHLMGSSKFSQFFHGPSHVLSVPSRTVRPSA